MTVWSSGHGAIGANNLDKALLQEAVIGDVAFIPANGAGVTEPNSETQPKDVVHIYVLLRTGMEGPAAAGMEFPRNVSDEITLQN